MTQETSDQYLAFCGRMVRRADVGDHRNECPRCKRHEAALTKAAIEQAEKRLRKLDKQTL